jgi:type II secretory pathway component GspD/PulD (secretin)
MKRALVAFVLAVAALPAAAIVSVRHMDAGKFTIVVRDEPLSVVVDEIAPLLSQRVRIATGEDPIVSVREERATPLAALQAVVRAASLQLADEHGVWVIQNPAEPRVMLDVKDADVREILRSMQKQCEIKNLVIDPKVEGQGTFVLRSVPCRTAFDVVTRTMSLKLVTYENNVVEVTPR